MANLELHQKKEELERLRGQLSEQYEKLVRQKRNFDAWAAQCREEVEQQAARLLARGEDLDRREADMGEYARRTPGREAGVAAGDPPPAGKADGEGRSRAAGVMWERPPWRPEWHRTAHRP